MGEIRVSRILPLSVAKNPNRIDKDKLIQAIKKQMAREVIEHALEAMEFHEAEDTAKDELIITGRVFVSSPIDLKIQPKRLYTTEKSYTEKRLDKLIPPTSQMTTTEMATFMERGKEELNAHMKAMSEAVLYGTSGMGFPVPPPESAVKAEVGTSHEWLDDVWTSDKDRRVNYPGLEHLYQNTELWERIMSKNFWETDPHFSGEEANIKKLPPVTVLVDGDIVAYRCAATCDGRHYTVDGQRFGYKKDAVSYADKKGIPNSEIELAFEPEPVDAALHNIGVTMENIRNWFIYECKMNPAMKVFLSDSTNFRYDIYPDYKKSRKNVRKPHWIKECKEYIAKQYKGFLFSNYEADDLIAMTADALREKGKVCIASCDKDFTQVGGKNVFQYDFTTGKDWEVSEGEAMRYFYKQILIGDKSDDIPGLPRVGNQTALKILAGCSEERDLYNAVVMEYKNRLEITESEAVDMVTLRGRLLYLTREEGKMWEPPQPRKM